MKTKRIITEQDAKNFFASSLNTMEDAMGVFIINSISKEVAFDFNSVLLLRFESIFANRNYKYDNDLFDENFINVLYRCLFNETKEDTEFEYSRTVDEKVYNYIIKLEVADTDTIKAYLVCIEKLLETESQLDMFSNVIGAGVSMFAGSTWWINYDRYSHKFYQSDKGLNILGMSTNDEMLYDTVEFQKVRENARVVSEFYDESIKAEAESYERIRRNETDYFGGRTPAVSADDEVVWVEAYGKCLIRYPDGSPRLFVAIDIYMSEIFENVNQLETLNNLIDYGLVSSEVGVWYYQKHFMEGRYYFTESYQALMASDQVYKNITVSQLMNDQIKICKRKGKGYESYLQEFREVHNSVFAKALDKYHLTIPNYKDEDTLQWIDVRGTVIERDEEGHVQLFVGVNVDVTESYNRRRELEQLRIQNERLQLAENLAIKARDLMVWYLEPNDMFSSNYIFGNDLFATKLGITRSDEGHISFDDLVETLVSTDKESKKITVHLLRELRAVINGEKDSIKKVLGKHKNKITGEILYIEHSVEVNEASFDSGVRMIGGILLDVTENILYQKQIQYLASHDILTGTFNRNHFEEFIKDLLPNSYSVIVFDLDGLKLTNDAFGHYEGDKVIKLVAKLLKKIFSDNLFVGRIGGDEFVVILDSTSDSYITERANAFEAALVEYNSENAIEVNVSKGGVIVKNNELPFEKAFIQAENIMYRRKLNSRSSRKSKVLESILETLNAKTEETKEHSDRLRKFSVKTMKSLHMTRASEVDDITLLAKVHDIGKITIPDEILHKAGKLTASEYEIVKKHCEAGYKIIRNITDSDDVCNGVLNHHERWDGTGYPQGLKGEEIPMFARIISVTDSYDAMTSDRVYQKKKTQDEAVKELIRCSGSQFDPAVVRTFLKSCLGIEMDDYK